MSYLIFTERDNPGKKTKVVIVSNKSGDHLGSIAWQNTWRQYVFKPMSDTIYSNDCVSDILNKINELNKGIYKK